MKTLRRLTLAVALSIVLGNTVIAGETNTPPCANPGETNTPPCSTSQFTIGASETSSAVPDEVETVIYEAATYAIESLLALY